MSISTMAARGLAIGRADTAAEGKKGAVSDALSAISAYIPSETLGGYIAAVGLFKTGDNVAQWAIYAGALLITLFLVFYYFSTKQQPGAATKVAKLRNLGILWALSAISFTVWASAVPASAFTQFSDNATRFGGVAALALAIILPKASELLKVSPPWRQ